MIDPRHPSLPVKRQCALIGISRSSWYGPASSETPLNLALMKLIDAQFMETPFYGSRQMARHLRNQGYCVSRKRVRRLMAKIGLRAVYQMPRTTVPHPEHLKYPYLLRNLVIDRPNQVWCADITLASGKQSTGLFSDPPHPDAAGFPLPGGDHGLGDAAGAGVAAVEYDGR